MTEDLTSRSVLTLGQIPLDLACAAQRQMEECHIDAERAEKTTNESFKSGVSDCYRGRVLDGLKKIGVDFVRIADEARVHRGTRFRWMKGEQSPDWDNLIVAATACRFRWDGVFTEPRPRDVMLCGVCRAMDDIRMMVLGKEELHCKPAEYFALWYISGHLPTRRALARRDPKLLEVALKSINSFVSQFLGTRVIFTEPQIVTLIGDWWDTYMLFHVLILFRWEN